MKRTLNILFYVGMLSLPFLGLVTRNNAQSGKPLYQNMREGGRNGDFYMDSVTVDDTVIKRDTQKIIMLVCDTSELKITTEIGGGLISATSYNYHHYVNWQRGYRVTITEHYSFPNPRTEGLNTNISRSTMSWEYLDNDKKPLDKNIIVWQQKTISETKKHDFVIYQ